MVRMLARRSLAKLDTHARPNEPDMRPKRTKKVRLGIYCTKIRPSEQDMEAISGQWLEIMARYQDTESIHGFWLANCEFGHGKP